MMVVMVVMAVMMVVVVVEVELMQHCKTAASFVILKQLQVPCNLYQCESRNRIQS